MYPWKTTTAAPICNRICYSIIRFNFLTCERGNFYFWECKYIYSNRLVSHYHTICCPIETNAAQSYKNGILPYHFFFSIFLNLKLNSASQTKSRGHAIVKGNRRPKIILKHHHVKCHMQLFVLFFLNLKATTCPMHLGEMLSKFWYPRYRYETCFEVPSLLNLCQVHISFSKLIVHVQNVVRRCTLSTNDIVLVNKFRKENVSWWRKNHFFLLAKLGKNNLFSTKVSPRISATMTKKH